MSEPGAYTAATELLGAELPDKRFGTGEYLRWLYDENPLGPSFVAESWEQDTLEGHYGLVRQAYRDPAGVAPFVFSLNAVTRSGSQRRGTFSRLGRQVWGAARDDGVLAVVGVTNDKSVTPVARQGWRLLCRLPVLVVPPIPSRRALESYDSVAAGQILASANKEEHQLWFSGWDAGPVERWANMWSPDLVRWRLAWPGCGPYVLHSDGRVLAVSTAAEVGALTVAVILKLVALEPVGLGQAPLSGHAAVTAACAYHRAPVAIYAGFNRSVGIRGWPLPERYRPAPLNLMVHSLSETIPVETFALDSFELLDMDAF